MLSWNKKNFRHSDGQNRTLQWPAPTVLKGRGATNFENGVEHYCIIFWRTFGTPLWNIGRRFWRRLRHSWHIFATADAEDPHVPQCALTHWNCAFPDTGHVNPCRWMHCSSLGQTAAEVNCLPSLVPKFLSQIVSEPDAFHYLASFFMATRHLKHHTGEWQFFFQKNWLHT